MITSFEEAFDQLKKDYAAACEQRNNLARETTVMSDQLANYRKRNKALSSKVETLKTALTTAEYLAQEALAKGHRAAQEAEAMKAALQAASTEQTVSVNLTLKHGQIVGMGWR